MESFDRHTKRLFILKMEQLISNKQEDFSQLVIDTIHVIPITAHASIKAVSSILNISPVELEQKLKGENTSFFSLLEHVKKQKALTLIQDEVSIEDISRQLGYESDRTFTQAFRQWTELTPKAYLKYFRRYISSNQVNSPKPRIMSSSA